MDNKDKKTKDDIFKNEIDLHDLMGLPPKDKAIQTQDESEGRDEGEGGDESEGRDKGEGRGRDEGEGRGRGRDKGEGRDEGECPELDSVINSEVEGAVDANSATQDSTQNIFGTDSYEENELDKQLKSSNQATSKEWQKEDKEAEMAEAQNEDLKQRVIQVLKRFKGETQAIEQLRETNPQAYTATLDLVNTMLQLARTLGLAGGNDEESTSVEEGLESPEEEADFGKSMVLPSKQTTRHIPKSRRPMGSMDNKGLEKILDEEKDINWVNRRDGVVRDDKGKVTRVE